MMLEYFLEDLPEIAKKVINNSRSKIILFEAEMGVGKTTLIKEICKQLGVKDLISSPTYSLVNEYEGNDILVYHFDFYRIKDEEEAFQIGFEEYLITNAWIFIEWPEKIMNLLPEEFEKIKINLKNDKSRVLNFVYKN